MCFAIPLQVKEIKKNTAVMENGRKVRLGNVSANTGDYLEVYADVAVNKISSKQALSIRRLIKKVQ